MFSERQVELVIQKVNHDVDIPLLGENREAIIVGKLIRLTNRHLEPSLRALCGDVYTNAIKKALDESMSPKQRSREVTTLIQGELSSPLAKQLMERSNALNFLGSHYETSVMRLIANKILEESVEWILEKVEESQEEPNFMSPESHDITPMCPETREINDCATGVMLSERQIQRVINKVNEDVDLPLMTEKGEEEIIKKSVRHLVVHMEPSLNIICGSVYTRAIKTALNESMSSQQRSKEVTKLLQGEMAAPLARELTERSDIQNYIGLRLESSAMNSISEKIIEEFVEWLIVEVDEKF
jgi:phosphoribosyl-ATP pyrophosphohydrolase